MSDATGASSLQFDTAVPKEGAAAALACQGCAKPILSTYYDVSGKTMCAECRTQIGRVLETPSGVGPLVMAGLFGLGAGIAGAIVYYAVIAITNFEIGIVAILIGWMVGYAVRKGAGGGGRRFQVMAVALTYAAVAMAYAPLAIKGAIEARRKEAPSVSVSAGETSAAPEPAAAPAPAPARKPSVSPVIALVLLTGLILALPVLAIVGSMPSGLISAAIIFFGMKQAWKMTGAPALQITGPFRVGGRPAVPA